MIHGKIEFSGESDGDVESAIEAALDSIRRGNTSGFDRNDTGSYTFSLSGDDGTLDVVTCKHCGRVIVQEQGRWVDPQAAGDDSVWRESCDGHDTMTAEHEPELEA